MAYLITTEQKEYKFKVGPQEFDDTVYSYKLCLKLENTYLNHPTVVSSNIGITLHEITINDDSPQVGDIALDSQNKKASITLEKTDKTVKLKLSSNLGIEKLDVFLSLETTATDSEYVSKLQDSQVDTNINFNLLNINPLNFGRIKIENYYGTFSKSQPQNDFPYIDDSKTRKTLTIKKLNGTEPETGDAETSPFSLYKKAASYVISSANLNNKINEGSWHILNTIDIAGYNPAFLKFDIDDVIDNKLKIVLNKEHILNKLDSQPAINSNAQPPGRTSYPKVTLYFYFGGQNLDAVMNEKLLNLEKRNKELESTKKAYENAEKQFTGVTSTKTSDLDNLLGNLNRIITTESGSKIKELLKQKFQNNLEKLYVLNSLNKRYETLMSQKDEILESDKKYEVVTRAIQLIQKRITFYRERIKKLGIATMVVHITLAVIIILGGVKQVISK